MPAPAGGWDPRFPHETPRNLLVHFFRICAQRLLTPARGSVPSDHVEPKIVDAHPAHLEPGYTKGTAVTVVIAVVLILVFVTVSLVVKINALYEDDQGHSNRPAPSPTLPPIQEPTLP